jgi:Spy/CpxP family protein refolding chaperone
MVQKILIGVLLVIVIGAVAKEQVLTVNKIKDEILAKKLEVKELRKGFYETMLAQIKAETFDKNKVNKLFTSKETKIKDLRVFIIDKLAEFHAILTPEQRVKAEKYIVKFHKRHRRWHR